MGHGLGGNELDVPSRSQTPFPAHFNPLAINKLSHLKHFVMLAILELAYCLDKRIPVRDAWK